MQASVDSVNIPDAVSPFECQICVTGSACWREGSRLGGCEGWARSDTRVECACGVVVQFGIVKGLGGIFASAGVGK